MGGFWILFCQCSLFRFPWHYEEGEKSEKKVLSCHSVNEKVDTKVYTITWKARCTSERSKHWNSASVYKIGIPPGDNIDGSTVREIGKKKGGEGR